MRIMGINDDTGGCSYQPQMQGHSDAPSSTMQLVLLYLKVCSETIQLSTYQVVVASLSSTTSVRKYFT